MEFSKKRFKMHFFFRREKLASIILTHDKVLNIRIYPYNLGKMHNLFPI